MKKLLVVMIAIFATCVACAKPAQLKQKATTAAKPEKQSWFSRQTKNLFGSGGGSRVAWTQKKLEPAGSSGKKYLTNVPDVQQPALTTSGALITTKTQKQFDVLGYGGYWAEGGKAVTVQGSGKSAQIVVKDTSGKIVESIPYTDKAALETAQKYKLDKKAQEAQEERAYQQELLPFQREAARRRQEKWSKEYDRALARGDRD